ncbi:hypothetical protein N658DRAFT_515394 [Parathielavia hyrcaniae]|uniref:2-dehydropantoate 2-reductase n=1 Tax=Parathielavia hyrcaniae TaxID=113614 RepID=A0AAN6Q258_9PEZI|nr:hypothetical protein N658DRAFT_515394 [Parathielavia hyrcaniae]
MAGRCGLADSPSLRTFPPRLGLVLSCPPATNIRYRPGQSGGMSPLPLMAAPTWRIQSRLALWDSGRDRVHGAEFDVLDSQPFTASDQIHVMGLDLAGRYMAHTLAGCRTIPPVRYVIHNHFMGKRWHENNKQLTLYRGHHMIIRRRIKADFTSEHDKRLEWGPIHNLVVTLPACQVLNAIGAIRHRLDHRSTICLVNDGLGVAEALIEAYFPDQSKRPIFLLGHLTTSLDYTGDIFSVSEVRPGRLYLTLLPSQGLGGNHEVRIKRHPPLERTVRGSHFIRLLTAIPGLNATGHPIADFMRYKLPTVAFRAIADPLAALFECRYDGLRDNPHARQLMDRLLAELSGVLSRLPECRDSPKFRQVALFTELRDKVFRKLLQQRTADSKMRSQVGRGWDTDVDFLSGYFVRRGRQIHYPVEVLDSVMWAIKAKRLVELKKLIRKARLEQLKSQSGAAGGSGGSGSQEQAQRQ